MGLNLQVNTYNTFKVEVRNGFKSGIIGQASIHKEHIEQQKQVIQREKPES